MPGPVVPPKTPAGRPPKIEIPRGMLVAILAALAISVVALAFLLGRESTGGRTAGTSPTPPAVATPTVALAQAPTPAATPTPEMADPFFESEPNPPSATVSPQAGVAPTAPTPTTPTAPVAPGPDTAARDAVARYFQEVEAIQSGGKYWSDPEALARTLIEEGAKGDASGFDNLLGAQQRVLEQLAQVAAPAPCQEHHRRSVALLEEAITTLTQTKENIQGGDTEALNALTGLGHDLESKAKDVDTLAAQIKKQHGIVH